MCLALLRIRWRPIKATLGHISSHRSARLRVTRYLLVVYHLLVQYLPVRHLESPGLLNHTSGENANGCSLELQKSSHWTLEKIQKDKCKPITLPRSRNWAKLQDQCGLLERVERIHTDRGWPILTDLTRKHITEGKGFSKLWRNNWNSACTQKILIYTNIVTKLSQNYIIKHKIIKFIKQT